MGAIDPRQQVLDPHQLASRYCHNVGGQPDCATLRHPLVINRAPSKFKQIYLISQDLLHLDISHMLLHLQLPVHIADVSDSSKLYIIVQLLPKLALRGVHNVLVEFVPHWITHCLTLEPRLILVNDELLKDEVPLLVADLAE